MLTALMKFVQYENQDKFQILEDTPPSSAPHSPELSASPGLFFSRLRRRSHEVDDEDDCPSSPCSSSTADDSSPVNARSSESSESDAQPETPPAPPKGSLKRKGLSVVDDNVSPLSIKRFRFEEHCFNYERIVRRQQNRLEKEAILSGLEKRLVQIDEELDESRYKLIALESMASSSLVTPHIEEVVMRRRALRSINRVMQRKLADSMAE